MAPVHELMNNILEYDLGAGVTAYTAGCDAVLPAEVTVGHQVHGDRIAVVGRAGMSREDLEGYDALVTDLDGCAIAVRTADCIPILLHDPINHAVAAIHSGWRGTVLRISQKTIAMMTRQYGTVPSELRAMIGPGICRECFQVGQEVVETFRDAGFNMDCILFRNGRRVEGDLSTGDHIDLIEANAQLLAEAGVRTAAIQSSGICTYADKRLFSARRQGNVCGRNINAIMLEPSR